MGIAEIIARATKRLGSGRSMSWFRIASFGFQRQDLRHDHRFRSRWTSISASSSTGRST